jgi:hypothetical protein
MAHNLHHLVEIRLDRAVLQVPALLPLLQLPLPQLAQVLILIHSVQIMAILVLNLMAIIRANLPIFKIVKFLIQWVKAVQYAFMDGSQRIMLANWCLHYVMVIMFKQASVSLAKTI